MRIGVVSDTHNNLHNVQRIVELFNAAEVARVVHTGDISQPKTLDAFAHLRAPLHGVYGNNDVGEQPQLMACAARHGFHFVEPPLHLHWHDRHIIVTHDPKEFAGHLTDQHELLLHGHTHRLRVEYESGGRLIFNPGECAGYMRGRNAIGIVDLDTLTHELLYF